VPDEAQCQDENISQQLTDGTRYFDFRCENQGHGLPDALAMYHGTFYEGSFLDSCLASIYSFLAAHPTETVLVSFLETGTSTGNAFADDISDYMQQNIGYWYFGNTCPTLGQVRGKIVLFNRYGQQTNGQYPGIDCLGWQDNNASFNADSVHYMGGPNVYVQDEYEPPFQVIQTTDESEKWTPFENQILAAWGDNNMNNFYFNNLSLAWRVGDTYTIQDFASALDSELESYCTGSYSPHRYGVIYVDWSNSTIASDIYKLNNGPFTYDTSAKFVNKNSGLVLNGSLDKANGTPVTQYDWANASQEEWTIYPLGGALYAIGNDYSNNYLDIAGGSTSNGSTVDTYAYEGSINQKFYIQADSDNAGCWDIISLLDGKVIEVGGNSTANDAAVDQWTWVGHPSQCWGIEAP